jgi:Tol biopolymer transport system component
MRITIILPLLLFLLFSSRIILSAEIYFDDLQPKWSPYGERILFSRSCKNNDGTLNKKLSGYYIISTNNRKVSRIGIDCIPSYSNCCWGRDANEIIYTERDNIILSATIDGNKKELVFDFTTLSNPIPYPISKNSYTSISNPEDLCLSPDKSRLVFCAQTYSGSPFLYEHFSLIKQVYDIYILDIENKEIKRITNWNTWNKNPVWSLDGNWILFASTLFEEPKESHAKEPVPIPCISCLLVYNLKNNNSGFYQLGKTRSELPCWSAKGEIFYSKYSNDREFARICSFNSKRKEFLTSSGYRDLFPNCSPDGKQIVFSSNRNKKIKGMRLFVMDADGNNIHQISF